MTFTVTFWSHWALAAWLREFFKRKWEKEGQRQEKKEYKEQHWDRKKNHSATGSSIFLKLSSGSVTFSLSASIWYSSHLPCRSVQGVAQQGTCHQQYSCALQILSKYEQERAQSRSTEQSEQHKRVLCYFCHFNCCKHTKNIINHKILFIHHQFNCFIFITHSSTSNCSFFLVWAAMPEKQNTDEYCSLCICLAQQLAYIKAPHFSWLTPNIAIRRWPVCVPSTIANWSDVHCQSLITHIKSTSYLD